MVTCEICQITFPRSRGVCPGCAAKLQIEPPKVEAKLPSRFVVGYTGDSVVGQSMARAEARGAGTPGILLAGVFGLLFAVGGTVGVIWLIVKLLGF